MNIEEQSYSGKTFRPKPIIHIDESLKLVVVCTSWSTKAFAADVVNSFVNVYASLSEDIEATSPFEKIESLSLKQNNLRTALLLTNKETQALKNKSEYLHGCEILVGVQEGQLFSWIQIGNPSIFIKKGSSQLISVGSQKDLSMDFAGDNLNSPLPEKLLGVQRSISFDVQSCRISPEDQMFLLSSALIQPQSKLAFEDGNLNEIAHVLSEHQPNSPFWLAKVNFSQS